MVVQLKKEDVLAFISQAPAGDEASKQFSLLLYSLCNVLPDDSPEKMASCQELLEVYVLTVLKRVTADAAFAPVAPLVFRVVKSALDGVAQHAANAVIELILEAVSQASPVAPLLLDLLPITLGHLCQGPGDSDEAAMHAAKSQEVVKRLCGLKWPATLTAAILAALRDVKLTAAQEQQVLAAAFKACERIDSARLPAAGYQILVLPTTTSHLPKLHALCQQLQAHRAAAQGADAVAAAHSAESELLRKLTAVFTRDKALANSWLRDVKKSKPSLPAAVALTVSIVGINRSAAPALDAFKASLGNALKHVEELEGSPLLAELHGDFTAALPSLGRLLYAVVRNADAALAVLLLQAAMHLLSAGKLKGVDVGCLGMVDNGDDYHGLRWWALPCSSAARLSLIGVSVLEQVSSAHA